MDKLYETPIILERTDASRNMARFCAIFDQPTLFGELSLIRKWVRIGARGREQVETFPDREGLSGPNRSWSARSAGGFMSKDAQKWQLRYHDRGRRLI